MSAPFYRVFHIDARHRLVISLIVAAAVWFAMRSCAPFSTQTIATWDAFAVSILALSWSAILTTPQSEIRAQVKLQDVGRIWIFVFVVIAACAGLFAVVFLLHSNKEGGQPRVPLQVALVLLAVISSWAVVHTVFGLRYAHTFYGDSEDPRRHAGGLEFPGESAPDYLDFVYFSFVIGMTFQVSDVQITARGLRQLVLIHGILSFAFNTIILALMINTVSALI
jgi:uncharacterized membrane protein